MQIRLAYNVNFEGEKKAFEIDNYCSYIKNDMRNIVKLDIKKNDIQSFYADSTNIVRNVILGEEGSRYFEKNGATISDVEVISISIESTYATMLESHHEELIEKSLELADADAKMKVVQALAKVEKEEADLAAANKLYKLELDQKFKEETFAKEEAMKEKFRQADAAANKAKADMQEVLAAINEAQIAREKAKHEAEIAHAKELAAIEESKQAAYAKTVVEMLGAIQPGLIEAIQGQTNADLANGIASSVAPYAIAGGHDISEVVAQMLRGTTVEDVLKNFSRKE